MRHAIVNGLEWACEKSGHAFSCRLAMLSLRLDQRWRTGEWGD